MQGNEIGLGILECALEIDENVVEFYEECEAEK